MGATGDGWNGSEDTDKPAIPLKQWKYGQTNLNQSVQNSGN